jgi:hypothetical protein
VTPTRTASVAQLTSISELSLGPGACLCPATTRATRPWQQRVPQNAKIAHLRATAPPAFTTTTSKTESALRTVARYEPSTTTGTARPAPTTAIHATPSSSASPATLRQTLESSAEYAASHYRAISSQGPAWPLPVRLAARPVPPPASALPVPRDTPWTTPSAFKINLPRSARQDVLRVVLSVIQPLRHALSVYQATL